MDESRDAGRKCHSPSWRAALSEGICPRFCRSIAAVSIMISALNLQFLVLSAKMVFSSQKMLHLNNYAYCITVHILKYGLYNLAVGQWIPEGNFHFLLSQKLYISFAYEKWHSSQKITCKRNTFLCIAFIILYYNCLTVPVQLQMRATLMQL